MRKCRCALRSSRRPSGSRRLAVGQNAQLLHAVGFVIDRTDDRQSRVERAEDFAQIDLVEEVDEQVGRGRAAVDDEQFVVSAV